MTFDSLIHILPVTTPILIFAGWWFIRRNAAIFAARTEANAIAKDVQKISDEIRDVSQVFWLTREFDKEYPYEMLVLASLERLYTKITVLKNYDVEIGNSRLIAYRKALTLKGRTDSDSIESCKEAFVLILKKTTELNNHIDELIAGKNIENKAVLYVKYPSLTGFSFGLSLVLNYFLSVFHLS